MHRLSDYANANDCRPEYCSFESVIGRELVLRNTYVRDGRYGEYLVLECEDPKTSKILSIATGSITVTRQVERFLSQAQLPCLIKPERDGQRYILA